MLKQTITNRWYYVFKVHKYERDMLVFKYMKYRNKTK